MQETERGKRKNAGEAFYFWCGASVLVLTAIVFAPLQEVQLTALTSFYTSMTAVVLPLIALLRGADAYFNRSQQ